MTPEGETGRAVPGQPDDSLIASGSRGAPTRVAAIVLGPHRSGTSAVAKTISLLGADLPKNLIEANPTNPAGHWEPQRVADLNDEIFESAGTRWDDVTAFPRSWFGSTSEAGFRARAIEVLADEYGASPFMVLKDPRISRVVPFWLSVLAELEVQPCFVICVRNPLEVVGSLKKRDGLSTSAAALVWLRHMLDSEHETRSHPRVFVSYDLLLADWETQMRTVGERLGLSWPRLGSTARAQIEEFLSGAHQHHRFTSDDVRTHSSLPTWVKSAYATFEAAAAGSHAPETEILDEIRSKLDDAELAFGPIIAALGSNEMRNAVEALEARVLEREHEIDALNEALAGLERERTAYADTSEERGQVIAELEAQAAILRQRSERSEAEAANQATLLQTQTRLLRELEAQVRGLQDRLEQNRSEIEFLKRSPARQLWAHLRRRRPFRRSGGANER